MKSSILLAAVLFFSAKSLSAQSAQVAQRSAHLDELTTTIQQQLETHGERVLGRETYHWSTRLERASNCQVEMSVRITSNFGETTVNIESVHFSLVAIAPYGIGLQKKWLQLSCADQAKCILSTTTCSKKTKDGIVVDCSTANQKAVDSFALQLDGDAPASLRLERTFRQAVALCHQPAAVDF